MTSNAFRFPQVPADHPYMRGLLANAFGYVSPAHGILDPASGYPSEGWNQEPKNGVFLRSFTQLTAIGAWVELLANIAAGAADNPYLAKDAALAGLRLTAGSLLADQRNPALSGKGLLVNFLSLEGGERKGPLQESVRRRRFSETFGEAKGNAIWRALVEKGWLQEQGDGRSARIVRTQPYGWAHFDGVLAPYANDALRSAIMALLDQRAVTIIFGDNANLTAALARSIGVLLRPEIRDDPRAADVRQHLERFIDGQRAGYAHLYAPKTGTFAFGWDVGVDRFVGWDDGHGNWVTGEMNYLINEFRGPWSFVVLRYGLPIAALRNAGFKIKPYRYQDGKETYGLAAWNGSAFELLGLSLFMQEDRNPAWRRSLATLADIELDFSRRNRLPGLLSEAYSGNRAEYTGRIGIRDLAVSGAPLLTDAPSLYSLGAAYTIDPAGVERFLRDHWPVISALFTDHGPWEGWKTSTNQPIPYQTTAHTLSLLLGGINTAQQNMRLYLVEHHLLDGLAALYPQGDQINLLSAENEIRPWSSDQRPVARSFENGTARFATTLSGSGGLHFRVPQQRGASLSNGRLVLRYRSATDVPDASISFTRVKDDPTPPPSIPVEIAVHLEKTTNGAIAITLPATPALTGIGGVALTFHSRGSATPVDVSITRLEFVPFAASGESP
jgi:hypothetical protein